MQTKERQHLIGFDLQQAAVGMLHHQTLESTGILHHGVGKRLQIGELPFPRQGLHLRNGCGRTPKLRTAVNQRHVAHFAAQIDGPIQRRIAAAENQYPLAMKLRCVLNFVVNVRSFKHIRSFDAQPARLK